MDKALNVITWAFVIFTILCMAGFGIAMADTFLLRCKLGTCTELNMTEIAP
jgi:hypothetical protein